MSRIEITTTQLRSMIGLTVDHQGIHCRVVEILEDGPSLVLESMVPPLSIQPDQHGEAHRRVPQTYMVEILSPDQREFSVAFLSLEPID